MRSGDGGDSVGETGAEGPGETGRARTHQSQVKMCAGKLFGSNANFDQSEHESIKFCRDSFYFRVDT